MFFTFIGIHTIANGIFNGGDTSMGVAIIAVISYFIGNISPSTMLGKKKGVDIRNSGSGNAGTTNALRTLGAKSALITLLIDVLKGTLAVFIGRFAEPHVRSPPTGRRPRSSRLHRRIGPIAPSSRLPRMPRTSTTGKRLLPMSRPQSTGRIIIGSRPIG